jgi:sec-independent protein translocase protein TatA
MLEGLFQPLHLIVIFAVVLIIFGPGRLPELGGSLGKAIRDFKKALDDGGASNPNQTKAVEDSQSSQKTPL